MKYKAIELTLIWEKHYKNKMIKYEEREKYNLEIKEIFNKLLENKMIDKLIERSIDEYRSSYKDPILEGLKLAKMYINKNKISYTKEDLNQVDQAIEQINKIREKQKRAVI